MQFLNWPKILYSISYTANNVAEVKFNSTTATDYNNSASNYTKMGASDAVFNQITKALETQGDKVVKDVKAVFVFKIKDGKTWVVDLKHGKVLSL